jgi:hypothetical protein
MSFFIGKFHCHLLMVFFLLVFSFIFDNFMIVSHHIRVAAQGSCSLSLYSLISLVFGSPLLKGLSQCAYLLASNGHSTLATFCLNCQSESPKVAAPLDLGTCCLSRSILVAPDLFNFLLVWCLPLSSWFCSQMWGLICLHYSTIYSESYFNTMKLISLIITVTEKISTNIY